MSIKLISAKASEIRLEGESWGDALARAAQLLKVSTESTEETLSDINQKAHAARNIARMQSRR